jgi:hypothetical protein
VPACSATEAGALGVRRVGGRARTRVVACGSIVGRGTFRPLAVSILVPSGRDGPIRPAKGGGTSWVWILVHRRDQRDGFASVSDSRIVLDGHGTQYR